MASRCTAAIVCAVLSCALFAAATGEQPVAAVVGGVVADGVGKNHLDDLQDTSAMAHDEALSADTHIPGQPDDGALVEPLRLVKGPGHHGGNGGRRRRSGNEDRRRRRRRREASGGRRRREASGGRRRREASGRRRAPTTSAPDAATPASPAPPAPAAPAAGDSTAPAILGGDVTAPAILAPSPAPPAVTVPPPPPPVGDDVVPDVVPDAGTASGSASAQTPEDGVAQGANAGIAQDGNDGVEQDGDDGVEQDGDDGVEQAPDGSVMRAVVGDMGGPSLVRSHTAPVQPSVALFESTGKVKFVRAEAKRDAPVSVHEADAVEIRAEGVDQAPAPSS